MYPRNNASPERLLLGQVVLIADGTIQSSGVTITVRGQGGAEAAGGGTTEFGADNSIYYTPTQAETDFTSFTVIASKAACFSTDLTVVTSASSAPGQVDVKSVQAVDQTANDNGADINTLITRIVGTLAAGTHNPASTAQLGALTDWLNGGRLDLLLDAIKAKTDPVTFTVANEVDVNVKSWFDTAVTGDGDWASLATSVTNIVNRVGSFTGTGVNTVLGFFQALMRSDATDPSDLGGTYAAADDSTQAIRAEGDASWGGGGGSSPQLLQSTTIATLASQTSFTLTAGSDDDDVYNNQMVIVTDSATSTQKAIGLIADAGGYVGATKTITLDVDPGVFTMAAGDSIDVIAISGSAVGLAVDASGNVNAMLQGFLATPIAESTAGRIAGNFDNFYDNADAVTTKVVDDVGGGAGASDWSATERDQIRHRLQIDGTQASPAADAPTQLPVDTQALNGSTGSADDLQDFADSGYDPVTNKVEGVKLADTTTTNTDMRGTDGANTVAPDNAGIADIQSRLPAALLGGRIDSNVGAISGDSGAADNLEASLETMVLGTATGGTASTVVSGVTGHGDDTFIGRVLIFRTGTLQYEAGAITDYDSASGTFTFAAATFTTSPTTETFVIV